MNSEEFIMGAHSREKKRFEFVILHPLFNNRFKCEKKEKIRDTL